MTLARALLGGLLVAALITSSVASAQRHRSARLWRLAREPRLLRATELVLSGLEIHRDALERYRGPSFGDLCRRHGGATRVERDAATDKRARIENAIARFERAIELVEEPEFVYRLAMALETWERPESGCAVTRRDDEAIAHLERLRARWPDFEPGDVAFELGLLRTRVEDFAGAAREYEDALALSVEPLAVGTLESNLAEVRMSAGDLREAVVHFERAVDIDERVDDPHGLTLALFGLALALDRLGEHSAALDRARRAISVGGGSMGALRGQYVFFVPPWELYAYEALGFEASADRTASLDATPSVDEQHGELGAQLAWALAQTDLPAERSRDALAAIARAASGEPADTQRAVEVLRAVRLETLAEPSDAPRSRDDARLVARAAALTLAALTWSRYLDEGGSSGRWAPDALAHLARLRAELGTLARDSVPPAARRR